MLHQLLFPRAELSDTKKGLATAPLEQTDKSSKDSINTTGFGAYGTYPSTPHWLPQAKLRSLWAAPSHGTRPCPQQGAGQDDL